MEMDAKQKDADKTNPIQSYNTVLLYGSIPTLSQYLLYNMFRILRPIRYKYNLTINEIIILNGMVIYNKMVSSSFTANIIKKYIGYFNSNKINYYIKSLEKKGYIVLSDIMASGYNRYKLTELAIDSIDSITECYQIALEKFIKDNNIVV